jgi:hypothetical protein
MVCAICQRELCESEAACALFWNLELNNDYEPEDAIDPYERYEEIEDGKGR